MNGIDPSIIVGQLALLEALGVALMSGVFGIILKVLDNKREAKREAERADDLAYRQRREADEKRRKERDKAIYGVVLTTARGTELLLHHAHGEQLNGDVEKALDKMDKAISKYNNIANDNMVEL